MHSLVVDPGPRTARVHRGSGRGTIGALGAYVALSLLFFGLHLLPHPGRAMLGSGRDPEIFVWSFAWWQHALGAGENPFVSHAVYAPDGINLAWATS